MTDQQHSFERVVQYLENHDHSESIVTVKDLVNLMGTYCEKPYTNKWMKKKLMDRFSDNLMIASMHGKSDVVIFHQSVDMLLQEFYSIQNKENSVEEKDRIIKLAAKFILNDVKKTDHDPTAYFKADDITAERQLEVLPESLVTFLKSLLPRRSKTDNTLPVAAIGQSI